MTYLNNSNGPKNNTKTKFNIKHYLLCLMNILFCIFLSGCQRDTERLFAKQISFQDLPGFESDALGKASLALHRSCHVTRNKLNQSYIVPEGVALNGSMSEWEPFCKSIEEAVFQNDDKPLSNQQTRNIIKKHLTPYIISLNGHSKAQLTGYYEPLLHGSLKKTKRFKIPLYREPSNLEKKRYGISTKIPRRQIVKGALNGYGLEIVYVDSAIDAFFLEIQGSGRIILNDGRVMRVGFKSHNQHKYHPIGKTLVEEGHLPKNNVTMQSIKKWLKQNPHKAQEIMNSNESYVFFTIRSIDKNSRHNMADGPFGSQGVKLTAKRSLAVDTKYISLGTPLWIVNDDNHLSRLMVAQDTGGAIKGGLRGDFFWGFGHHAENHAGTMNTMADMYMLLPRTH